MNRIVLQACRSSPTRIRQSTLLLSSAWLRSVSFLRCFSTNDSSTETHQQLLAEARRITIRLYRTCLHSVRIIRTGNAHDEAEFRRLEERQLNPPTISDPRLAMLSMTPPVNRQRELHSRAEYYWNYVQEHFINEMDIFHKLQNQDGDDDQSNKTTAHSQQSLYQQHHQQQDFEEPWNRYFHFVRHGMTQRTWLLQDMKFEDPFQTVHNDLTKSVNDLEQRVNAFLEELHRQRGMVGGGDPVLDDDDFWKVSSSKDDSDWEDEDDDDGY